MIYIGYLEYSNFDGVSKHFFTRDVHYMRSVQHRLPAHEQRLTVLPISCSGKKKEKLISSCLNGS